MATIDHTIPVMPRLREADDPEVTSTVERFLNSRHTVFTRHSREQIRSDLIQIARVREGRGALRAALAVLIKTNKKLNIETKKNHPSGGFMKHTRRKRIGRRRSKNVKGYTLSYDPAPKYGYYYLTDDFIKQLAPKKSFMVLGHELAHLISSMGKDGANMVKRMQTPYSEKIAVSATKAYTLDYHSREELVAIRDGVFSENDLHAAHGEPLRVDHSGVFYKDPIELERANAIEILKYGSKEAIDAFDFSPHVEMVTEALIEASIKNPDIHAIKTLEKYLKPSRATTNQIWWAKLYHKIRYGKNFDAQFALALLPDLSYHPHTQRVIFLSALKNSNPQVIYHVLNNREIQTEAVGSVLNQSINHIIAKDPAFDAHKLATLQSYGLDENQISLATILKLPPALKYRLLLMKDETGATRLSREIALKEILKAPYLEKFKDISLIETSQAFEILNTPYMEPVTFFDKLAKSNHLTLKDLRYLQLLGYTFPDIAGILHVAKNGTKERVDSQLLDIPTKFYLLSDYGLNVTILTALKAENTYLLSKIVQKTSDIELKKEVYETIFSAGSPEEIRPLLGNKEVENLISPERQQELSTANLNIESADLVAEFYSAMDSDVSMETLSD
ncbi:MAG: hypothetical protein MRY21_06215 [Simkaniaceae bacterium]|nr:hypothetical protein [Simkaniaceae bacterium]